MVKNDTNYVKIIYIFDKFNQVKKFSANWILDGVSEPIKDGVLLLSDSGEVIDLLVNEGQFEDVLKYEGIIVPGFVNSHCHLELSHLKGLIPEGNGLVNFIEPIISLRECDLPDIINAISIAEMEMINNGIVAVGDICNNDITFELKSKGRMKYHNFIEVISFNPEKAMQVYNAGIDLLDESNEYGIPSSISPHAPYTASSELLKLIANKSEESSSPTSIHMNESKQENLFLKEGKGDIAEFYSRIGVSLDFFHPSGKSSFDAILDSFKGSAPLLLVHNTYTEENDIFNAVSNRGNLYWCFCPNANLYIEQCIPDINLFLKHNLRIVIGTDSLASNWNLSIIEELKIINSKYPNIPLNTLIQWSTINGARFLGFDGKLGSFEKGKIPGVNLLEHLDLAQMKLCPETTVTKLI